MLKKGLSPFLPPSAIHQDRFHCVVLSIPWPSLSLVLQPQWLYGFTSSARPLIRAAATGGGPRTDFMHALLALCLGLLTGGL